MCHSRLDPESILQVGTHFEGWMPENKFSMTTSFLFILQRSLNKSLRMIEIILQK